MRYLLISAFLVCSFANVAVAEYIKSSAPCPYSCESQGYGKKACKDSKEGSVCTISVKKKAIGKGRGTYSKACPFSCEEVKGKSACKDWKEGETCFVKVG